MISIRLNVPKMMSASQLPSVLSTCISMYMYIHCTKRFKFTHTFCTRVYIYMRASSDVLLDLCVNTNHTYMYVDVLSVFLTPLP